MVYRRFVDRPLNTNLENEVKSIYKHWSFVYNNSSSPKTCYILFEGMSTDKASFLILATGNSSDRCCCRHIKVTNYGVTQSTLYQGSTSACWNGNLFVNDSGIIVNNLSQATGIALTNVEPFAIIEIYCASSIYIRQTWIA